MILSRQELKYYLLKDSERYSKIPNFQDFILHNEKWFII